MLTALVAVLVTPLVPDLDSPRASASEATWDILSILASSMLVVATFSLGTMVQAFAAAASPATPRAARVLIDDPFSQNVLATFLGAFVFAMVGPRRARLRLLQRSRARRCCWSRPGWSS